jgi:glycosyltransferase involved in cell wall biosynthesis
MHVLIVTTYFPPDSGAAAVRLGRLSRILAARGHRVTVLAAMPHYPGGEIAAGYRGRFCVREKSEGVESHRLWLATSSKPGLARRLLGQVSFMFTAVARGLFIDRADVMLIEAQPMFTNFAGSLLAVVRRIPAVQNVSDLWPDHLLSTGNLTSRSLVYRMLRAVTDASYRRAARIVAMSPVWADAISKYIGDDGKIRVVYNGVDLQKFAPNLELAGNFRRKFNLPAGRKIVSFIGSFTTQNDFDTLFQAMRLIRERGDFCFVLIGGGTQTGVVDGRIEAFRREGLGDLAQSIGWISHEDIPGAWAASDIAVMALHDRPLYAGTVPAKYFEAFACAVPVIGAVPGIAASLLRSSGAGVAVNCGDSAAVAREVARLLDDEGLRKRLGAAGREYAVRNFDQARTADAYEAILSEAAAAARRQTAN